MVAAIREHLAGKGLGLRNSLKNEYLERYYQLANSPERMPIFHQVFAMFRGAVGSASEAARGKRVAAFCPMPHGSGENSGWTMPNAVLN